MLRNRWLLAVMVVGLNASLALAATTFQHLLLGTTTNLLTTQLTSLGNNVLSSRGATYDPRIGQTGQGYKYAIVECSFTFSSNPTVGRAIAIWFIKTSDGTTFEDDSQYRVANVSCPVRPSATTTRVSFDRVPLPPWRFGAVAYNDNTGVTLSSGNVSITPYTDQGNP